MTQKDAKDLTFTDLAKMARDEAEAFSTHIIGEAPRYRTGREVRYLENQSLVVFISGNRQGKFKSFLDEEAKGDLFDLWRYIRGGNNHDAVMGYKAFAGIDQTSANQKVEVNKGPSKEELEKAEAQDIAKRKQTAQWIWRNASKTEGRDEAIEYFKGRSINFVPDSDTVRYKKLTKHDLEKMNIKPEHIPSDPVTSIIFKATNEKGELCAVQQILVSCGKKLACDNPKRTNGYLIGSSVKFGDVKSAKKIAMAEGPETAMSVHQATGLPTEVTLGTSNFTNIHIARSVDTLIIATDMDESGVGLASSLKAAQFWARNGIENTGIAIPRLDVGDFNDVAQAKGDEAVAKMIDTAFFPDRVRQDDVVLVTADSKVAFHAWVQSGISTAVRIPPINPKTGERSPINLDAAVSEEHKIVFVVNKDGFKIDSEYMEKHRKGVTIIVCDEEADAFLLNVRNAGYIRNLLEPADIYDPKGRGTTEPLAITLRRKDADALIDAGHRAVAIRPSESDQVDLSFMKGRKAIVAPLGKGTSADQTLFDRLAAAGAEVTKLTWQIFHPTADGLKIVRDDIPKTYGAAEAVAEGWCGKAMGDLLLISELNKAQISKVEPEQARAKEKDHQR